MLSKKYKALEIEKKWQDYWQENGIYKFDKTSNAPIYSVDTPPPTVNGKIHIGHIFSYSQAEIMARYKRLKGYNVSIHLDLMIMDCQLRDLLKRHMGLKHIRLQESISLNYV